FGHGVVHPPSGAPVHDEARLPEDPKVVRHEGLSHLDALRQLAHRGLTPHELLENPEPRLVAQRTKAERGDGAAAVVREGHRGMISINIYMTRPRLAWCFPLPSPRTS